MHCPECGSTETEQQTKMLIIMQLIAPTLENQLHLPGAAIDCAMFYCVTCGTRWFMEKGKK